MSFLEVEFPRTIAFKSSGGPSFSTVVNKGFGGQEFRNRNWLLSRGKWKIDLKTPASFAGSEQNFADALRNFFYATAGQFLAFRLWDPADHKFAGPMAPIGGAVGSVAVYQLQRQITLGGQTYTAPVNKLVYHTVTDFLGAPLTDHLAVTGMSPATSFTVDATTGIVTFNANPTAAPNATGEFHYPVRFDSDALGLIAEESFWRGGRGQISVQSMGLIEVRAPNF